MDTYLIELTNSSAHRLLQDLEDLKIIKVLKKELQKNVISLKVKGYGERREQHPKNFLNICFKYHIVSNDLTESELRKLVTLSETKYCPVWSMINENVKTNVEFIIEKG